MNFESHSQAGQDRFAYEIIGDRGTFLDIGGNHPIHKNNTYALERSGWHGIAVENDEDCVRLFRAQRPTKLLAVDATNIDWNWEIGLWRMKMEVAEDRIDYLSLDVDESSLYVLEKLMDNGTRFSVLTVEHDAYRFGTDRRDRMVKLLQNNGYDILCADVCDQGMSFEIWAVDPLVVDMAKAEKFRRSEPTDWKEFFV